MSKNNNRLIVLAQSLEQPRIVKRIVEKSEEFDSVQVYGFKREIHDVNNYAILDNHKNISLTIVGKMSNHKYFGRIISYIKLLSLVFLRHGLSRKNLYVFGLDLRILAVPIFNKKIDYEISDIMWLYKFGIKKKLLRKIDYFLVGNSNKVIFTSRGFYETYYKHVVPIEKVVFKENKFKTYGKVLPIVNIKIDFIRIAYIGAFRYDAIIKNLLQTVIGNKKLILNFYGDGHNNDLVKIIKETAFKYHNISFKGAFKNPDDLEQIYSENNLNFVVYNNNQENERVAMPNKYYESGFFNIPIVCAENTYVGKRVLEQNMGWTIGTSYEEISKFLNNLKIENLIENHKKIKELDKSLFSL